MSANVSDIKVGLLLDASQYVSGWKEATAVTERFEKIIAERAAGRSIVPTLNVLSAEDVEKDKKEHLAQATARLTVFNDAETASIKRSIAARQASGIAMAMSADQMGLVHGRTQRLNVAMMQLGFAVEDASVSFGTGGLAGALRGATNNIAAVAGLLLPQAALLTTAALAAVNLGFALSKTGEQAKKAALESESFKKQIERIIQLAEAFGKDREFQLKLAGLDVAAEAETAKEVSQQAVDENQIKIDKLKKQEADFRAARLREEAVLLKGAGQIVDVNQRQANIRVEKLFLGLLGDTFQQQEALMQRALELRNKEIEAAKELAKTEEERVNLQKEFNANKQKAAELAERELEAEDRANAQKEKEAAMQKHNIDMAKTRDKMEQDAKRKAATEKSVTDDIIGDLDPMQKKINDIIDEFKRRQDQIAESVANPDVRAKLLEGAMKARDKKLQELQNQDAGTKSFEQLQGVGAFRQGSREAFSLIQSSLRGKVENPTQQKQLKEAEKHTGLLDQINQGVGANGNDRIDFVLANF